jgi:hypothetical protein
VVAAALVAALLVLGATACTRPADQRDAAVDQAAPVAPVGGGGGVGAATPTTVGSTGTSPTTSGPTSVAGAIAAGDFGSLQHVCGPAPKGQVDKATGSQGVTATSMKIGVFADPDNTARPGLDQELFDTADVFSQWCNGLGGIAGRKILVDKHDSGLFRVAATMADACRSDFYLVGGGSVLDDGGVDERLKCLLPQISGFVVTDKARLADLQVQPQNTPDDVLEQGIFRFLTEKFPATLDKVGLLTGNLPALETTSDQYKQAAAKLGWKTVYSDQYNAVGESTWAPYAAELKQKGVKGLEYVGEPENLALLVQALADIHYKLDWILGSPNMYDAKLTTAAGKALADAPVYIGLSIAPFEYASRVPAVAEFLALFAKYKPSAKPRTLLAVNAMSAWLFFAKSATECGANLTRRCVYDTSYRPTTWDAGGIWSGAPISHGTASSDCDVNVEATPTGFVPLPWRANTGFFDCEPANLLKLTGTFPKPTTLADEGKSLSELR